MDSGRAKSRGIGKDFRLVGVRHDGIYFIVPVRPKMKNWNFAKRATLHCRFVPPSFFLPIYFYHAVADYAETFEIAARRYYFSTPSSRVDPRYFFSRFHDFQIFLPIKNLKPRRETTFVSSFRNSNT